jgi:hypothetical protein
VRNKNSPSKSKTINKSRNLIVSSTHRSSPPHKADSNASGRSVRRRSCVTFALPRHRVDNKPVTTDRFVVTPRVLDVDNGTLCVPAEASTVTDETGVNVFPVDFDT